MKGQSRAMQGEGGKGDSDGGVVCRGSGAQTCE